MTKRCMRLVCAWLWLAAAWQLAGCSSQNNPGPAKPPKIQGTLDSVGKGRIEGWAWDPNRPDAALTVDIYDGETKLETVTADKFRKDLATAKKGDGKHAFLAPTPESLKDGKPHAVHAKISETNMELKSSPQSFTFEKK